MNTITAPDFFDIRNLEGKILHMVRLFRFRYIDEQTLQDRDYVAAMENFTTTNRPDRIRVFLMDPITGSLSWAQDEGVYDVATYLYDRWRTGEFNWRSYRRELLNNRKYDRAKLLPHLEALEIQLIHDENFGKIAKDLDHNYSSRKVALDSLHKALCALDKGADMKQAADELIYTLWGSLDGEATAQALLPDVQKKARRLQSLYDYMLEDTAKIPDAPARLRSFILDTYWAWPCSSQNIRKAQEEYFHKSSTLQKLLDAFRRSDRELPFTEADIQDLWFTEEWPMLWGKYYLALTQQ